MQQGWYCRSVAEAKAAAEEQQRAREESKVKQEYRFLKTKLKHLIYENECFNNALRQNQKRLLEVTRDRSFLLNRLILYEKPENSSSDSEETESSEDEAKCEPAPKKRRESVNSTPVVTSGTVTFPAKVQQAPVTTVKRRRPPPPAKIQKVPPILTISGQGQQPQVQFQGQAHHIGQPGSHSHSSHSHSHSSAANLLSDGHMTPEEVERHLHNSHSRQTFLELERAPLTVPTEMFSNEPSLDSESNDVGEIETSPSNIGEELSIDMIQE